MKLYTNKHNTWNSNNFWWYGTYFYFCEVERVQYWVLYTSEILPNM